MDPLVKSQDLDTAVSDIIERCGENIILATALGLGKPNRLLNRLYQTVKSQPDKLKLTIYTALSLQVPQAKSDVEQRFLGPFAARHFGEDYLGLDYLDDANQNKLPDNISLHEFYFSSGSQLHHASAQQNYISQNYTHVARDLVAAGVNLVVQQVAKRGDRLSLSCNPDVILDLIEQMQAANKPLMVVGVVNAQLPFLGGDADVSESIFDLLVDDAMPHTLFGIPRESVSLVDHAIGLHASRLVKDGGTLQIGIGALSDAIVNALILRHENNADYHQALTAIDSDLESELVKEIGGASPFKQGLYGATEMVMDGFMHLRNAGILRRLVFDDLALQALLDQQIISNPLAQSDLQVLIERGLISSVITPKDLAWMKKFGLVEINAKIIGANIALAPDSMIGLDLNQVDNAKVFSGYLSGRSLTGGRYLEGAFFLGSKDLYAWFRQLKGDDYQGLWMRRVSHINKIMGGKETLDKLQRKDGRFFNTCMMHTLLGAAVSDGLDTGQVVSGVGGQYNFVAMAHELDDGRSIILLRSTRTSKGRVKSNILWNYGHTTIPRHLRDIVITEYGIADLRGQSDAECIKRLLAISDARFQGELLASAKKAGKIDKHFTLPSAWQNNCPAMLMTLEKNPHFSQFPLGSDFDQTEQQLINALTKMKCAMVTPQTILYNLLASLMPLQQSTETQLCLERMGLSAPQSLKNKMLARLLVRFLN
jgi:acyl-CoA hydrolase